MTDDDELDPPSRAALDAWTADEPTPGFADRVLAAARTPAAPPAPPPRRSRRPAILAAFAAAALVAGAAIVVWPRDRAHPAAGAHIADARAELHLGNRGVAVVEPGAQLTWQVAAGGAAEVEQTAGDIFYRVERGGSFVVHTPAGDIRVTGTCFRVEVPMKRQTITGAAVGAALAAAVVVTVYEGGVVVADSAGERKVAAGERATLGGAGGETIARAGDPGALAVPPPADATRDVLLTRDAAQREQIRQLTEKVATLQQQLQGGGTAVAVAKGGPGGRGEEDDGDGRPWFDPSPELLAQFAAECRVRFDLPPVSGSMPHELRPRDVERFGIEPGEVDAVNAAMREIHTSWRARLAALYVEATGDADRVESLSSEAMSREIEDKAAPGEAQAIRARIARERAGLEQPPADLSKTSPLERYLRAVAGLGDEFERVLGKAIGPERARAMRESDGGWPHRTEMIGCPEGSEEDAREAGGMQIDAAWAAQMMRSHAGLLAGGNAKWLLEDLLYGVPLEAQQRIEARIAADGGTRTFFQLACDWVELARGEADVLAFVEAALRGAGADVTIERPPVPPPPPAAVIRRVAPRPTTIVLDEVSEMVAVDGFDPPRVLATGPGEAAVPRDGLVCVRPIRFLSMAETAAWLGAMTAPIGVGLRNTAPSAEALTALGEHGGLEVLYLPHTPRGLEGLHGLPHLALASPAALDDAAVAWLRSLPALRAIDLGDVAEPIGRLADLTGFTHVSALRLGMWSAVEQAAVASWPSLVSIDLGPVEEPVTAETLAPLAALPRLARLRLPGVHEDDEIAALARALPPRVRVIA